jgi:hypothetical protein
MWINNRHFFCNCLQKKKIEEQYFIFFCHIIHETTEKVGGVEKKIVGKKS